MLNVYRASAGSGKTHRLTGDYIHLLFSGEKNYKMYRRILAVTFTNKATEEMKSRILAELYKLASELPSDYRESLAARYKLSDEEINRRARKILVSLLHDYAAFSVSTIDRFFQQLIRSFARENGINGAYNLELDNDSILQQAADNLFIDLTKQPNPQLLAWLAEFSDDLIRAEKSWNPRKEIITLGKELFKEGFQSKSAEIAAKIQNHEFLRSYKSELNKITAAYEKKMYDTGTLALQIMEKYGLEHSDFSRTTTKKFEEIRNKIFKDDIGVTFTAMSENVEKCWVKKQIPAITQKITDAYNNGLGQCFKDVVMLLSTGKREYNSAKIILKNINTLGVLSYLDTQIKALTSDQNAMLISDANMLVNKIIDGSDTPFIFEKTGVYTDNFMIDEFQDTSALQWKNFRPLIENSLAGGSFNLVVGDVKQSIYRWRNSDWKLLDQAIFSEFSPEQLTAITLDTNWRSDRNIVNFNNALFSYAPQVLQTKLNMQIPPDMSRSELAGLTTAITKAYEGIEQKTSPRAGDGLVKFTFLDSGENGEKWKTLSLERLPHVLEEIQNQGFNPADVAILVRKKDETKTITQKLLEYKNSDSAQPEKYCYDVLGNEGLVISKSGSVNFIVSLLRLFVQPNDAISRTNVSFEYLKGKKGISGDEALNLCFTATPDSSNYCPFFTPDENQGLAQAANLSLYELTGRIIRIFDVSQWGNDAVFLQAFRDEVFTFSSGRKSDTGSFLKWWDEKGSEKFIPMPDTQNAFRIMTIHKSKGLDFKVVIMPFCDWELDMKKGYLKNYLWCLPSVAPFNGLSLLPVEYTTKLENSVFAGEYFNEKMHLYVDNLNLAYVAFTRAKHRLICFTEKVNPPKDISKVESIAGLLNWCFTGCNIEETEKPVMLTQHFDSDTFEYCAGEIVKAEPLRGEKTTETASQPEPTAPYINRTDLKFRKQKINGGAILETENARRTGIAMHALLSKMHKKSDQEKALQQCINEGMINSAQKPLVVAELEKFWSLPETGIWFAPDVKVLNEATILTPQGEMYRPDRVVINDTNAIVVDYKFGEYQKNAYKKQVKEYKNLLTQMGYSAKGYIYYVNLGKVTEVE